ncbi:MAG TPA: D-glycerate dehydrogenase [Polyangiaceae bacterium]|jgi:glyoxylate reductase
MARIFVSAPLPGDGVERLTAAMGEPPIVDEAGEGVRGAAFAGGAASFEALITLLTDRVDEALLARAPKVKVVANVAVGFDNVDLAACRARGIAVTNTPGVLTEATADLAFGLLLAASRRIAEGDRMVRAGEFVGWAPTLLVGKRVQGASLGLVGMGRIGQAMARRARGFGMHVAYVQPRRLAPEMERALGATWMGVDELFASSEFVSLHCPLTPETRGLVTRARLASMLKGSVLVNTARGACVDEEALADALEQGPLAAAGLDVFEREPLVHPRLLALPNVVLAPHIGSADAVTRRAMTTMAVENALAVLGGREPPNRVA